MTWRHADNLCGPSQFGARAYREVEQALLHFRVMEIQGAETGWGCLDQVARPLRSRPVARLVPAGFHERLVDTECYRFGDAPGMRDFSPKAVAELGLALDNQYPCPMPGECHAQRRTGESSPDNRKIILH